MSERLSPPLGPEPDVTAASERRTALVCPGCHGTLVWSRAESACEGCSQRFEVVDGIPILLIWKPKDDNESVAGDRVFSESAIEHKLLQAQFFDEEDADLETCRPHGQPAFYGWLLDEKLRRSITALRPLEGISAVTICGGSGMDAEFLARRGTSVISVDVSLGAARRARERGRRFGVSILSVVADAERLPLGDKTVDLAYVHDGLHHLADPDVGIGEMARVSRRAVSITEPAQAVVTAFAVRLGFALEHEEAGNRVSRMRPDGIERTLAESGFCVVHCDRYAMYYRQLPGMPMRFASRRRVLPWAVRVLLAGNRVAGRLGNKLTVQAVRSEVRWDRVHPDEEPPADPRAALNRCA